MFVTGLPTGDVDDTLGRLIGLEAVVALIGVGLAAVAGLALVRRQLRPLREVAATAAEVTRTPWTPEQSAPPRGSRRSTPTPTTRSASSARRST